MEKARKLAKFSEIRDLYRAMGPVRFTILIGGLTALSIGAVAIHGWLCKKTGWPEAYGFHCRGRGCLWVEMAHSHLLWRTATLYEILLFAWLWLLPGGAILTITIILMARWLKRRRNRIRPLD